MERKGSVRDHEWGDGGNALRTAPEDRGSMRTLDVGF